MPSTENTSPSPAGAASRSKAPDDLDLPAVGKRLRLPEETVRRLDRLGAPATVPGPVLPDDTTAEHTLRQLGANAQDREDTLAARPDPQGHPELLWIGFFTCESWLMDPQLADYLPAESNITRFQQRFRILPKLPESGYADHTVLGYVFGQTAPDSEIIHADLLDRLPQDTTLRQAIVTHLRRGGHWYQRTGWLAV